MVQKAVVQGISKIRLWPLAERCGAAIAPSALLLLLLLSSQDFVQDMRVCVYAIS